MSDESNANDRRRAWEQLLEWAEAAGLNQTELGNRLGLSAQAITNWKERGVAFFVGDQLIATGVLPDRSDAFVSIVWR